MKYVMVCGHDSNAVSIFPFPSLFLVVVMNAARSVLRTKRNRNVARYCPIFIFLFRINSGMRSRELVSHLANKDFKAIIAKARGPGCHDWGGLGWMRRSCTDGRVGSTRRIRSLFVVVGGCLGCCDDDRLMNNLLLFFFRRGTKKLDDHWPQARPKKVSPKRPENGEYHVWVMQTECLP